MKMTQRDLLNFVGNEFVVRTKNPGDLEWEYHRLPNLVTIEGMTHLLNEGITSTLFYLALKNAASDPILVSWTYANLELIEITLYDELTRPLWDQQAIVETDGVLTVDNDDSGVAWAAFTMNDDVDVYGICLVSHDVKGDFEEVGAIMFSAANFAVLKEMLSGGTLEVMYRVGLRNAVESPPE